MTCNVSFVCQKCAQPLKIDTSFDRNLDREEYKKLSDICRKLKSDEETIDIGLSSLALEEDVLTLTVPPARNETLDSGGEFTLLGDPEVSSEHLSLKMKISASLFDVLSGQSELDHPLCEECTDTLLDELDKQLSSAQEESIIYSDFLKKLEENEENQPDENILNEELEKLTKQKETMLSNLEHVENDQKRLEEDFTNARSAAKKTEEEERAFFKEYNEYKRQLLEYDNAQKSVELQLRYAQMQLDKHKKTNVFNITFHIWHNGSFGTINGFRLGRLPNKQVDWSEINAAWGQTVLLLHSLSKKVNLTFKRFILVPYGSHSYIESLADKSRELPLYGSGGFRFFWDTKFDQAMVAFLDCLQQFKEEVERCDSSFCLPYPMDKGKIEDPNVKTWYSIKTQLNSEEQWTKALKFMLTNLKWGLTWVSTQYDDYDK
ncbi:DgyrCDS3443 [Dimorphilus gyrociliatus]|uniref:DgyrCDS3443 n=1 Tax=Dimorphilus gyrociliatus TaxID=2664684 RepID=A0A7I8VF09_9ANNE|nr:DgyrCDS3443 [Dimorphilus gyrociliatus]